MARFLPARVREIIDFMTMTAAATDTGLDCLRERIDGRLAELVPRETVAPERLHRAMRYSLLAPGKRVRPIMTILMAEHLGASTENALDTACAIEMVHASSLIFDDLPCMDDASLRRGRPANHIEFGEETATLAAVALLSRSFGVISESAGLTPSVRSDLVTLLSHAIGTSGLAGGQEQDLNGQAACVNPALLEDMHYRKTAILFALCTEAGARIAGVDEARRTAARDLGAAMGLAFQTFDDLIDVGGKADSAGKDVGQDGDKHTFVSMMVTEQAEHKAGSHLRQAEAAMRALGEGDGRLYDFIGRLAKTHKRCM